MKYGYARVSTVQQDTAMQMAAFRRAGVTKVVEEKKSGKRGALRPLLEAVLSRLRPGDSLVVYKVDRLARSLADLLAILERVVRAGASFKSLTEPIDTSDAMGEFLLQILGAVAQLNRSMILQACAAGRREAAMRGVVFGRPAQVDRVTVLELRGSGLLWREVAAVVGMNLPHVKRIAAGRRVCDGAPSRMQHLRSVGA